MKRYPANGTVHAITVRDELLHHIETAVKGIRPHNPSDARIHRARKQLKRARANLRLLRDAVGEAAYTRENIALRDAARPLSSVRDAAVLRETADQLIRAAQRGTRRRFLLNVRRALEQARITARAELRRMNAVKQSVARLDAAMVRIRKWNLERADVASLCNGLHRSYRRARKALATSSADPTNENLHEWRKQVKYLGQALEVWKTHGSDGAKRFVKRTDKLAELLGTDHDLVVFEERLEKLDSPHPILPSVTNEVGRRRRDLRKNALKKGRLLFKAKPRSFIRTITQQR